MAKRYNLRSIKKNRNYTFEEVAELLNVHEQTVRGWVSSGLRSLRAKKPYLIIGEDLLVFHRKRTNARKSPLGKNQLYCLTCREPKVPFDSEVEFIPKENGAGLLVGLCADCTNLCNRFVQEGKISAIAPDLVVTHSACVNSLKEPTNPPVNTQQAEKQSE
ncbi:helix-turn-helix domain-containing protein [Hyphococcus formosus]|uniref:helix-turn-helix domain-containing protein n=1 Tax=Hyphococcus formosus TaxID=3143534 RepID=UPI00398AFE42